MKTLGDPEHDGGGAWRTFVVLLLVVLVVIAIVVAVWLLPRPPAGAPKGPPVAPRAHTSPTPAATPAPSEARATPRPRLERRPEPRPAVAAPTLRVDADVPGANVFLDRKFLGTTPVETRDFAPGPHRLNVSADGYDMYGETIELAAEPRDIRVRFKEVRLDERVDVVHKHGVGSCHGRLLATTAGLRYEADKPGDSFEAAFVSLEPLQVDYLRRNLRVKAKDGKTWNFTSGSADALLAFQKAVEKARARM
jgi:PEGA domain